MTSKKRWKAVTTYRTDIGPMKHEHYFEEIEDLHHLIERLTGMRSLTATSRSTGACTPRAGR